MKKFYNEIFRIRKIMTEAINTDIYFETFSSAVQKARSHAESKGYEIDEDSWFTEVNTGPGKPKQGNTTRMNINLIKNGKPQKKSLQIQIYNRGDNIKNNYELNYYIL